MTGKHSIKNDDIDPYVSLKSPTYLFHPTLLFHQEFSCHVSIDNHKFLNVKRSAHYIANYLYINTTAC